MPTDELLFSVDIEASGPTPSTGSLIALGACLVYDESQTFYRLIKPLPGLPWLESAERATGYWTTRAERDPGLNARTSGVYWRADPEDLRILDGRDDQKRRELIAERLEHWKSFKNA